MTAHLQDNTICQRAMEESATQTSFRHLRAEHSDTDIQIFTESAKLSSLFRAEQLFHVWRFCQDVSGVKR